MNRAMIFAAIPVVLILSGCTKAGKECVGSTPEMAEAIGALRGAYAAFNRGDIDAAVQPLDQNIDWSEPAEFPAGGTFKGRDAVKGYLEWSRLLGPKEAAIRSDLFFPGTGL